MKNALICLVLGIVLTAVTVGLGVWGLELDPWDGEVGGNNPLILLALPTLICVMIVHAFRLPPTTANLLGWGSGVLIQFIICLLIVILVRTILMALQQKERRNRRGKIDDR